MNIALTGTEWISKVLAIVIATVCFAANFYFNDATLIYKCCLALCFLLLVRAKKHKYLFLVFCFISSYVILLFPYFLNNLSIAIFSDFNRADAYQKTIYLFSILLSSLLFFFKDIPEVPVVDRLPVYDSNVIFAGNLLIMVAVLIFGASGETIITASYGQNQGSVSTVYAYFPIFFLASYISSGRKQAKLLLINLVGVAFIIKSLMFGGRGSTISMFLMMYLLFFDSKISFPALLVLAILGFAFFSIWGHFRVTLSLSKINFSDVFSLGASYKDKYTAMSNNQTDVFYASVRLVSMVDIGLIDTYKRIEGLGLFCLSVFVPYSYLPPLANLASYNLNIYNTMGGGLIFAYFYTYLSYFGIVFIGYLINKLWNVLRASTNRYTLVYAILALVTINGWFAYNPITLFKLCLWGVFYILAIDTLNSFLVSKRVSGFNLQSQK